MAKKPFVPVVAVLNMKGGVGKTTLCASLFRRLFEEKRTATLLLDLDPQFNLTQALFKRQEYEKLKDEGKTISAVFDHATKADLFEISDDKTPPPDVDKLTKTFWSFTDEPSIKLSVVPGDFDLVRYSLMDDNVKLLKVRKRFEEFVNKSKSKYDLVVLDCNPSSSFLTVCALSVCTHVLVPVRMDKYSVLGLEMLWDFVHKVLPINPKPAFIVVLNGVKRSNATKAMIETEAELRGHGVFGVLTLANSIRETGQLVAKTNYTGFSVDRKTSVTRVVKQELNRVSAELSAKLGIN